MSTQTWIGEHPHDGRYYRSMCARCGSSLDFEPCDMCAGEGVAGHDCGEDCCVCLYPEPNVLCDCCHGEGSYPQCLSQREWCESHPLPGREDVARSTPEWFVVEGEA